MGPSGKQWQTWGKSLDSQISCISDNSEIPRESRPPCLPRPWASIILNPIELLQTKDLLPSDHQKFEKILLYDVRLEQS